MLCPSHMGRWALSVFTTTFIFVILIWTRCIFAVTIIHCPFLLDTICLQVLYKDLIKLSLLNVGSPYKNHPFFTQASDLILSIAKKIYLLKKLLLLIRFYIDSRAIFIKHLHSGWNNIHYNYILHFSTGLICIQTRFTVKHNNLTV